MPSLISHSKCVRLADSSQQLVCCFPQHGLQMGPQHMQDQVGGYWRQGIDFGTLLILGEECEMG